MDIEWWRNDSHLHQQLMESNWGLGMLKLRENKREGPFHLRGLGGEIELARGSGRGQKELRRFVKVL